MVLRATYLPASRCRKTNFLKLVFKSRKASGYTTRARAEAAIGRFKQVIGDGLRSRTDDRRATEVGVAVYALNRMLELGRPSYVRTA